MTIDKSHSRFQHVYAMVRIDLPADQQHPTNAISAVQVFMSKLAANHEVSRLRNVNKDEGPYDVFVSRLVP